MPQGDAISVSLILLDFLVAVSKLSKMEGGCHEKLLILSDECAALIQLPYGRHSAFWAVAGNVNMAEYFWQK